MTQTTMRKLTIAVDFDGTIVTPAWPSIGDPIPVALSTIREWVQRGHSIVIWTCRAGRQLTECQQWLVQHKVPHHTLNANTVERIKSYGGDTRKVSADLYVDDKGVGCIGVTPQVLWARAKADVRRLEGGR